MLGNNVLDAFCVLVWWCNLSLYATGYDGVDGRALQRCRNIGANTWGSPADECGSLRRHDATEQGELHNGRYIS